MVEVWIPMLDGRWLVLPRHTQPKNEVQAILDHIQITLPSATNQSIAGRCADPTRGGRRLAFDVVKTF